MLPFLSKFISSFLAFKGSPRAEGGSGAGSLPGSVHPGTSMSTQAWASPRDFMAEDSEKQIHGRGMMRMSEH